MRAAVRRRSSPPRVPARLACQRQAAAPRVQRQQPDRACARNGSVVLSNTTAAQVAAAQHSAGTCSRTSGTFSGCTAAATSVAQPAARTHVAPSQPAKASASTRSSSRSRRDAAASCCADKASAAASSSQHLIGLCMLSTVCWQQLNAAMPAVRWQAGPATATATAADGAGSWRRRLRSDS